MSWPLVYLIAVCVLIADVLFVIITHRHVEAVHDREAAFRPRELRTRRTSVATPSDAARVLAAHGADQRAKRATTTDTLRAFVAAGGVSKLGWKVS